jgi:hypothetical protein
MKWRRSDFKESRILEYSSNKEQAKGLRPTSNNLGTQNEKPQAF